MLHGEIRRYAARPERFASMAMDSVTVDVRNRDLWAVVFCHRITNFLNRYVDRMTKWTWADFDGVAQLADPHNQIKN